MRSLPTGVYVFADLDRLDREATERAGMLRAILRDTGAGVRVVNDPIRSMRRFELLRQLHARGINSFSVYRLTDLVNVQRFPVFIRAEDGHDGSLTSLLRDPEALNRAVDDLVAQGKSRDNKLVVEYVDCRDALGRHQKFSALFAGSEILQTTQASSEHWVVKDVPAKIGLPSLAGMPRADHESRLRQALHLARIDYGRVDYAIVHDRVQVFEINTNPVVWPPELLLAIARTLDVEGTLGSVRISMTYRPAWRATNSIWYYTGRAIHRGLRLIGLMRYEDPIVRRLRAVKRRLARLGHER